MSESLFSLEYVLDLKIFFYCVTVSIRLKCWCCLKSLSEPPDLPCSPFSSVFLCPVSLAFLLCLGRSSGFWVCDPCASFGDNHRALVNPGHFVGRIKGDKYRFELQFLKWDFS